VLLAVAVTASSSCALPVELPHRYSGAASQFSRTTVVAYGQTLVLWVVGAVLRRSTLLMAIVAMKMSWGYVARDALGAAAALGAMALQ
jgi:hypothetical protein